jgi:hypothetical protein
VLLFKNEPVYVAKCPKTFDRGVVPLASSIVKSSGSGLVSGTANRSANVALIETGESAPENILYAPLSVPSAGL